MEIVFRNAEKEDCAKIVRFIRDLAEFEKLGHEVKATEEAILENLFGPNPYAEVIFAAIEGLEVGFALFFHNFSTFLGKSGIYIEDLYVTKDYRGKGIGRALLQHIASIALSRGCGRVEWWVLKWNPARRFYENIGAEPMDEWVVYRLSGEKLAKLADEIKEVNG